MTNKSGFSLMFSIRPPFMSELSAIPLKRSHERKSAINRFRSVIGRNLAWLGLRLAYPTRFQGASKPEQVLVLVPDLIKTPSIFDPLRQAVAGVIKSRK